MVLQVAASESGFPEAREIKIDAAHDCVGSVIAAVGAALGVAVKELSLWDDDFEEFTLLEDSTLGDLVDGAKVEVQVG